MARSANLNGQTQTFLSANRTQGSSIAPNLVDLSCLIGTNTIDHSTEIGISLDIEVYAYNHPIEGGLPE